MVRDLNFPLEIITCKTVREKDGLACSSRNTYLSAEGRKTATILYRTLKRGEELLKREKGIKEILNELSKFVNQEPGAELDYIHIVDPETLEPLDKPSERNLLIIACRVEGVRLIDNLEVEIAS